MVHLLSVVLSLFVVSTTVAAPLEQRQLGNLQCNIDRIKIVADLVQANIAVKKIDTSDAATASAVSDAQAGLSSVTSAIESIALSLVTGKAAPGDARTAVSAGLNQTRSALEGINNPAVASAVSAAEGKVQSAIDAGNGVIANCK
ncbi:hypothetical protein C8F01DRAFT_1059595 [Mycena amicta]|nr:hypothetical protein C8F01DRAFT_1059595 [Mycena amicta]